jgi:translation initiation factor 1
MGKRNRDSGGLVYSTEHGRLCPGCGRPAADCRCGAASPEPAADGIVRLHRETKGRGGKAVTLVRGLPLEAAGLKALARQLKQKCGVGGACKDGVIEIQGDQRPLIKAELEKLGFQVKIAGG